MMNKLNKDIIKLSKDHIVLDAGTGTGKILDYLAENSKLVYGVDSYEKTLQNIKLNKKNIILEKKDLKKLGFVNKFDRIFCLEVLEHIKDPLSVIKNLHKALKKDGICIISVPTQFSEKIYSLINSKYNKNQGEHISIFKKNKWIYLFERAGFKLIKTENKNYGPFLFWFLFWLSNKKTKIDCKIGGYNLSKSIVYLKKIKLLIDKITFGLIEKSLDSIIPKSYYFYLEKRE